MHRVLVVFVQAEGRLFRMDVAGHQRRQRHRLGHLATLLVEGTLQSWNWPREIAGGQVDAGAGPLHPTRTGLRLGGEQRDRVHPSTIRVASEVRVALPDRHRHYAVGQMRVDEDARVHLPMV